MDQSTVAGPLLPPLEVPCVLTEPYGFGVINLTFEQTEELRRAGERLAAELHRLFEAVAPQERTVRDVATALGIDRNIAQRALASAQPPVDGLQVFMRMPGVRSLRLLIKQARASRAGRSTIGALDAAVNEVENLILTIGGHQSRLRAMIRASVEGTITAHPDDVLGPTIRARMLAYRGAVDVAGSQSDLNLSIRIHRLTPGDPTTSECATIKGVVGHRSRPGGMAFALQAFKVTGRTQELGIPDDWGTPLGPDGPSHEAGPLSESILLRNFSTPGLPITSIAPPGSAESHIVEPTATHVGSGVDIIVARKHGGMPSPLLPSDPELTHISHVALPTKRLLLDVYLHRDLAARAAPYFAGYIWSTRVEKDIQGAWFDRIPGTPPLATLGRGLTCSETDAWSRHAELTRYTFERLGWDPSEYVGFRGDVVFPIWAAKYVVVFAFEPRTS